MSLCPRAAAQALQSPPELHQHEYKHDAAYFDESDYPQYTLHPSSHFGPDQEPLLDSRSSPSYGPARHAAPTSSCLPTSGSRRAWLSILLVTNLALTVAAFIAACVHFNTFTTLFLYLALLIVAFPILSLSLLVVNSGSYSYKVQLPDWSPSSTPLSEQSFSSFSGFFSRSSTPACDASADPIGRRSRSCRPARLETSARYAQYVFAVLWFLAIVEWLFFRPILPANRVDDMASFINTPPAANSAPQQPMKVFIASNLYNSEDILPTYISSLKTLINDLGPANVFVSIYESHSKDQTKPMLAQFDQDLVLKNVSRRVLSDDRAIRKGKGISSVSDRIAFLADVRNIAMQPLADPAQKFTHVLWVNDVIFTPQDALNLLRTNNARYDQACAMDFIGNGFYDTWVVRDVEGDTLKRQWPYFKRDQDVEAMREGRPFEVNSCWNGMTAFDAKWFKSAPTNNHNSSSPPVKSDEGDEQLELPLRFRTSSTCLSSECQLVSYDIHRALYPTRPTILINPIVKVAYNKKHYWFFNSLIPSPILRPWRIGWRDWVAYRLGGWVTEGRRWANDCKPLQKFWAASPSKTDL